MSKNYKKNTNKQHQNYHEKEEECKCECCSEENLDDNLENEETECEAQVDLCEDKEECRENEFKETLQRLQAEFDNYRKRTESQQARIKEDGIVYAIGKILPVLDSFNSAKQMIKDEEFLKSLDLIEKQLNECLKSLNITKIEALGQKFDSNLHNAVLCGEDSEKNDEEILEVYQEGYKLGDRVIRHSVVKINKLN